MNTRTGDNPKPGCRRIMKSIALKICIAATLLLATLQATASTLVMEDPFAGLEFDPADSKFEEISKADGAKLELLDGPWWLFAKYCGEVEKGKCFIVVSGFLRQRHETVPETYGEPEPDFGAVYTVENGNYTVLGVPDRLHKDDLHIGDRVIRGLMDDYAVRLVQSAGGSAATQQKVAQMPMHPWMDNIVAEALERAGVHVPREMILYGPDVPWMAKPKAPK